MAESPERPPLIFISYSHDSPAHKKWVGELATRLVQNGIDCRFDQWDLGLGDDVAKFMERGIKDSDRVVVICTETYVRKAENGKGGVGYEAMIITGDVIKDLGSAKFIPVVRQSLSSPVLPAALSTRFYANLADSEAFESEFDRLLREIHRAPAFPKPPLGKSPFGTPSPKIELPARTKVPSRIESSGSNDSKTIYETAVTTIRAADLFAWRKLSQQVLRSVNNELQIWREKKEPYLGSKARIELTDVQSASLEAAAIFGPAMCMALAGIESAQDKFSNQTGLIDTILHPRDWNPSGLTIIVDVPETIAFVYQALHGAICVSTGQLQKSLDLARGSISRRGTHAMTPLYKVPEIIGWPPGLGAKSTDAWRAVLELPAQWGWLQDVFGSAEDFQAAACAYYIALNVLEFVETVAADGMPAENQQMALDIPLNFASCEGSIQRRAYQLLLQCRTDVWALLQKAMGRGDLVAAWQLWVIHMQRWVTQVTPFRRAVLPHANLLNDLR